MYSGMDRLRNLASGFCTPKAAGRNGSCRRQNPGKTLQSTSPTERDASGALAQPQAMPRSEGLAHGFAGVVQACLITQAKEDAQVSARPEQSGGH